MYSAALAGQICARLADGESLRRICSDESMPTKTSVFRWLIEHKSFSDQYAKAREEQAELMADELLEIADDGTNDFKTIVQNGQEKEVFDSEHVQRSRLRIDTRKWIASKLLPKKYGEKITQEVTGKDGGPVNVTWQAPAKS